MDSLTLLAFGAAFFVFAASPGPDNVTIVARTLTHGPVSGLAYGLGTVAGILVFLFLSTFGLSTLAKEMGSAMTVLRYLGASYLVWMGWRMWHRPVAVASAVAPGEAGLVKIFVTGFVLNLGNPKMPLFYLALLPQVVGPQLSLAQASALAAVVLVVEAIVIGGYVALAGKARHLVGKPSTMRRVNRAAGAALIGAGVTVAGVR